MEKATRSTLAEVKRLIVHQRIFLKHNILSIPIAQHLDTITMKLFFLSAAALLAIVNGATIRGSEQTTEVSGPVSISTYSILTMN